MWTRFIDAHLHLQDSRFAGKTDMVIDKACTAGVCRLFCNATKEEDWSRIVELSRFYSWVIPFLAIHPWYADNAAKGWEVRLYDTLASCRYGAGVGETGLDRARPDDFARQVTMFETHMEIAASLDLPVAVHCVRCWGKLIETLESFAAGRKLPQTMIHSFSGSMESMKRLTDLGCYISYSSRIADPEQTKTREIFSKTPINLLLLETDAPDQINPAVADQEILITRFNEPIVITSVYQAAAQLRNLHIEDFADQLWQNATIYAHKALAR